MVSLLILSLQVHSFSFGGGTASDLASKLESYYSKPSVVLASIEAPISKISANTERFEDLFAKILLIGNLSGEANSVIGVSPAAWPVNLLVRNFGRIGVGMPERLDWTVPTKTSSAEKLTLKTKGNEVASMNDIGAVLEPMKVSGHWFFTVAEIGFSIENCSREDFAQATALALGAKLVIKEDSYRFDLDPKAFRQRALAAKQSPGPLLEMVYPPHRVKVVAAAYEVMTDEQILQAWQSRESAVQLPVSKGKLRATVDQYLEGICEAAVPESLKVIAKRSVGQPAVIQVSPNGVHVTVRQADGTTAVF